MRNTSQNLDDNNIMMLMFIVEWYKGELMKESAFWMNCSFKSKASLNVLNTKEVLLHNIALHCSAIFLLSKVRCLTFHLTLSALCCGTL